MAVSTCLTLAICEGALRLSGYSPQYFNVQNSFQQYDEVVGRRGKPNIKRRFRTLDFDVTVAQDERGFRRPGHARSYAESAKRAYVFGDSFTWGWGVGQGQVFTDAMSQRLDDYDIWNLGISGTGTVQQYALFEQHVKQRLQPGETVFVVFCGNDFSNNVNEPLRGVVRDGRVEIVGPGPNNRSVVKNWLKDKSYLFNLAAYQVDRTKATLRQRGGARRVAIQQEISSGKKKRDIPPDAPEVVVTSHILKQFRDDCRERQASFVVVAIAEDPVLKDVVHDLDIELIELLPHFQDAVVGGLIRRHTFEHDGHWNAAGHRITGNVLADYLADRPAHDIAQREQTPR